MVGLCFFEEEFEQGCKAFTLLVYSKEKLHLIHEGFQAWMKLEQLLELLNGEAREVSVRISVSSFPSMKLEYVEETTQGKGTRMRV